MTALNVLAGVGIVFYSLRIARALFGSEVIAFLVGQFDATPAIFHSQFPVIRCHTRGAGLLAARIRVGGPLGGCGLMRPARFEPPIRR